MGQTLRLSDLPQYIGNPLTTEDWNSLLNIIVSLVDSGNYDVFFDTVRANTFIGIPEFDVTLTAGETISAGDAVIIVGSEAFKATNASLAGITNYIGIASMDVVTGDDLPVRRTVYNATIGTPFTAGTLYYIGVNGALTATVPTKYIQKAGIAISDTQLVILPSQIQLYNQVQDSVVSASTSGYAILSSDYSKVLSPTTTGGNALVTLPLSSGVGNGWLVSVEKASSDTNTVSVGLGSTGNTFQTGVSAYVLSNLGDIATFISDGSGGFIVKEQYRAQVSTMRFSPTTSTVTSTGYQVVVRRQKGSMENVWVKSQIIPRNVTLRVTCNTATSSNGPATIQILGGPVASSGPVLFSKTGVNFGNTGSTEEFTVNLTLSSGNAVDLDLSSTDLNLINASNLGGNTDWYVRMLSETGGDTFTLTDFEFRWIH